jgi:hypothetical protein
VELILSEGIKNNVELLKFFLNYEVRSSNSTEPQNIKIRWSRGIVKGNPVNGGVLPTPPNINFNFKSYKLFSHKNTLTHTFNYTKTPITTR